MFLNSWSLALSLLSLVVLILIAIAVRTAIKVLCSWDPASDSNRQIRLENETWLSSTLVQYAMGFQIMSLILFVLAADYFSQVISGAMCATGSLAANQYGMPTLQLKLLGAFLSGFWIILHAFDISSERYPLLKAKYIALICLLPVLAADVVSQTLYLANLKPDIITSCCAVVFGEGGESTGNLLGAVPQGALLTIFYGLAALLAIAGYFLRKNPRSSLLWLNGLVWLLYLGVSLVAITTIFSSYIYAMPYHHCPFCILKPDYGSIGLLIYGTILPAAFFGISAALAEVIPVRLGIKEVVHRFQRMAVLISSALLVLFVLVVSYHFVLYRFMGGE
ncbi:MAG: hypothetical protein K0A99_04285 [Desulfoarculaceae bacterium]|nr:hypothetical protein [Desulfoarculaceae bacterium]